MRVIKKDGTFEDYNEQKIIDAVTKAAKRAMIELSNQDYQAICSAVWEKLVENDLEDTEIYEMHNIVESVLEEYYPIIAKTYKEYRNYKKDFVHMMDKVFEESQKIRYIGDKDNANTDSALVATKRSLIYNSLNSELYKKFFLNTEEKQAAKDGYIYIHDRSARLDTMNCCLFRIGKVMSGGFEMGNVWYNEPKTLDTAFDVMGDIILSTAAQQYGGFTVPRVDSILAPFAKKTYDKKYKKYFKLLMGDKRKTLKAMGIDWNHLEEDVKKTLWLQSDQTSKQEAKNDVYRDFEQGWQGIEYKLNTVGSSRGDYPFVTMTFGLDTTEFGKMASITFLHVHQEGQGKPGFKRPVLFPKLVFLYDKDIHGKGCVNEDVFNAGIKCSMKTMYPDWLSLTGEGYVSSMYKQYGEVISPMGCRAFLSPWYENGGMNPAGENDKPIFEGRFNMGAISLHLPMILARARRENKDFYKVLDFYLEMVRNLHKRTYDYLGELRASVNPVAYCEGGFYGGNLKPEDKIRPILKPMTMSFGITALNELQELYNGKSIAEDGNFALEVMEYINNYKNRITNEDDILYAIYGTPAESLCGLQIEQFRKQFGIIPKVSDRTYVSNSFHCGVWEDITPIEKQNLENRFWNMFNGGKIQYCRYPVNYNKKAVEDLIRRAMDMGLYEGVNLSLAYCETCGYEQLEMDDCPKCGSGSITKIDRMNGYLGFTRVHGDTRYNQSKNDEILDRRSM